MHDSSEIASSDQRNNNYKRMMASDGAFQTMAGQGADNAVQQAYTSGFQGRPLGLTPDLIQDNGSAPLPTSSGAVPAPGSTGQTPQH